MTSEATPPMSGNESPVFYTYTYQHLQQNPIRHVTLPHPAHIRHPSERPAWPHDHRFNRLSQHSQSMSDKRSLDPSPVPGSRHQSLRPGASTFSDRKPSDPQVSRAGYEHRHGPGTNTPKRISGLQPSPDSSLREGYSRSPEISRVCHTRSIVEVADEETNHSTGRHTPQALMHVGLLAPLLSIVIMLYSILILLSTVIVVPLHLCAHTSIRERLLNLLIAPLNLQRRGIFAPPIATSLSVTASAKIRTEGSLSVTTSEPGDDRNCGAPALFVTHILAPLVAIPIAIGAWITAFVWLPSAMISHERAEGVSDDERRMAERMVGAWFWWLNWCVREEGEDKLRGRRRDRGRKPTGARGEVV